MVTVSVIDRTLSGAFGSGRITLRDARICGGSPGQLPATLPSPAVRRIERDVQERQLLELLSPTERAGIDRTKADRCDELENRGPRGCVIGGDKAVELDALDDWIGLVGC